MTSIASVSTQTSLVLVAPGIYQELTHPVSTKKVEFVCPGHKHFFHHYSIYDRAKRRAQEAIDDLLKNEEVFCAHYNILERGTVQANESGHFNLLNSIYLYAVELIYTHKNNSQECSFFQESKK